MQTIELTEEQSRVLSDTDDVTVLDTCGRRYQLTRSTKTTPASASDDEGPLDLKSDDPHDWRGPRPKIPAEVLQEAVERIEKKEGPFFTTEEVFAHLETLEREGAA